MLNPAPATTTTGPATPVLPRGLTALEETTGPAGLFSPPVDVSLLEELEIDELGRRSRWLPADVLL
jgi:hypothetical protein